ncbi:RP-L7 [Acanthosepion pharaonis]|uniref:RP-L7 n=1 Tax=Acanthosepion pharaonis TaxID=158019 RepID=A0A812EMR8_ACAPH|nr:RP-L7 [Sepia pharaonis]
MFCSQLISFLTRRSVHCKRRTCLYTARLLANKNQNQESAMFSTSLVFCSEAPLAAPHIQGTEKIYAPKIQKLVDEIGTLTLLEVADLNELLKKTLNIQEAPMMAMAPAATSVKEEESTEATAPKEEQTLFTVKLIKFNAAKKVALIKEIKNQISGLNLVQAKKFVESAPQPVKTDISKEAAEQLKNALEAVGAEIVIE